MPGRFALVASPEQLSSQFDLPLSSVPELRPRYNLAPTQPVPVIRIGPDRRRELGITQWGLVPAWAQDPSIGSRMINARAETVAEKPSYRSAFKHRRCLIPALGFYEWRETAEKRKQPYFICPRSNRDEAGAGPTGMALFAFAGLWEVWFSSDGSEIQTCTIITTAANSLLREILERMPVIIAPADYAGWLDPDQTDRRALENYLRPCASELVRYYPVDRIVNNPRNDGPECLARIEAEGL